MGELMQDIVLMASYKKDGQEGQIISYCQHGININQISDWYQRGWHMWYTNNIFANQMYRHGDCIIMNIRGVLVYLPCELYYFYNDFIVWENRGQDKVL